MKTPQTQQQPPFYLIAFWAVLALAFILVTGFVVTAAIVGPPEFYVTPPSFRDGIDPLTEAEFEELQRWLRAEKAAREAAGDPRPIWPAM